MVKPATSSYRFITILNIIIGLITIRQNNQAWLERNQEKFGSRQVGCLNQLSLDCVLSQVKFGYVVFTEAETAERLFRQGGVIVRRASGERIQVCSYYFLAVLRISGSFIWLARFVSRGWMDCLRNFTAANSKSKMILHSLYTGGSPFSSNILMRLNQNPRSVCTL